MKKLKDYRIILTIWIALGIGVSGYFYIFPNLYSNGEQVLNRRRYKPNRIDYKNAEISILTTVVGSVLIGGIGFITSRNK